MRRSLVGAGPARQAAAARATAVELAPGLAADGRGQGRGGQGPPRASTSAGEALLAAIRAHGAMPLPPYIRRPAGGDPRDAVDYQTVFARRDGAVAAPTASLHLTDELLARLDAAGIERCFVTLHVGAGTFAPVKAEDTDGHVMHAEWCEVPEATAAAIAAARARGGRVVAVGTTVLRTLESRAGRRRRGPCPARATRACSSPRATASASSTCLLTNFHLPRSTLFMLVAAFAGLERIQAAYAHAVARALPLLQLRRRLPADRAEPPP